MSIDIFSALMPLLPNHVLVAGMYFQGLAQVVQELLKLVVILIRLIMLQLFIIHLMKILLSFVH